ncbi:MAG: hypothetical protein CL862_13765 [Cyanobium sp. NAT70]|nr:hypothetical protein [Cyanobium sp. NAT70]|tara:strand:+ start:1464 stop:1988 length:525 start_codon:yes stop_codon:yes gene_type:complete
MTPLFTLKYLIIACLGSLLLGSSAHGHGNHHDSTPKLNTNSNNKGPVIHLYREASCSCCTKWGQEMSSNGFRVVDHIENNMQALKELEGVPNSLRSCHTAFVGGYFIEGHVPVESINKLLSDMPNIDGLAVPGMPMGSPGMESANQKSDLYSVIAVYDQGEKAIYDTYLGSIRQ